MRVGFGTSLCDFDNDGWLDLFVLNGNSNYSANTPYQQEPQLFANLEGRRFVERSEQGGPYFGEAHSGRGSAAGDLNNDGAMDLVTILMNEPVRILRNRQLPENYVAVQLIGRLGDREATGARVSCEFDGRTLVRWVTKGAGYFSQGDGRIVLPIDDGSDRVDVQVTWLDRGGEVFRLATRARINSSKAEELPMIDTPSLPANDSPRSAQPRLPHPSGRLLPDADHRCGRSRDRTLELVVS